MIKLFRLLKHISLFFSILLTVSCDNEFNNIESDVIREENINFNVVKTNLNVLAYNKKLDSLRINNLSSNLLGFFNDPIYGTTKASIITQLNPAINNPAFGINPVLDSVVLNIPYFSRQTGVSGVSNIPLYALDSVFGNKNAPIKLSIYRNNFLLRNFNPNAQNIEAQNYYSNAFNNTNNSAITESLNINFDNTIDTLLYQVDDFIPNNNAIVTTSDTNVLQSSPPVLKLNLTQNQDGTVNSGNINLWTSIILSQNGLPTLSNPNNFNNYFRGIYINAETNNNDGQIILLNTGAANIQIYFKNENENKNGLTQSPYTLNFGQNTLNTFKNEFTTPLENGDKTLGDSKLYLKGTGSMAVVDLFNGLVNCEETNTEETSLECFKKTYRQRVDTGYILQPGETEDQDGYAKRNGNFILKRIINEAMLLVYEDEDSVLDTESHKNDKVYVYDIANNVPIIDHNVDGTDPTLGLRQTDENGISSYKIRVTEYLNSIILRDSSNTKLGLIISNSANITNSAQILNSTDVVTAVPTPTLLTPRGTVLHGSNANVEDNKKMTLEIFSTEPN